MSRPYHPIVRSLSSSRPSSTTTLSATPTTFTDGGIPMLKRKPPSSRQPKQQPWMMKMLIRERALVLSNSIDISTSQLYGSALNSWIAFIQMHHFPLEPNPDTLSFFVVFMSHHIQPKSVKSYLSGLVQQLEPDYPSIREIRKCCLVIKVMKGCEKTRGQAVQRKLPPSGYPRP